MSRGHPKIPAKCLELLACACAGPLGRRAGRIRSAKAWCWGRLNGSGAGRFVGGSLVGPGPDFRKEPQAGSSGLEGTFKLELSSPPPPLLLGCRSNLQGPPGFRASHFQLAWGQAEIRIETLPPVLP